MTQPTNAGEEMFGEKYREKLNEALVNAYQEGFNDGVQLDEFGEWLEGRIAEAEQNSNTDAYHALLDIQNYLQNRGYPREDKSMRKQS